MRRRGATRRSGRRWLCAAVALAGFGIGARRLGAQACPAPPQQTRGEVEVETRVAVARLARVTGGDLSVRTRQTVHDLMTRLPDANRVYLEQMLFAAYCSAVRDDRSLTPSQRAERLNRYAREVRAALYPPAPAPRAAPPPAGSPGAGVRPAGGRPNGVPSEDRAAAGRARARAALAAAGVSDADTAAFFRALAARDTGIVRLFLAAGLSPNVTDRADPAVRAPALAVAAGTGDSALVAALLAAGAGVDRATGSGRTALFWALNAESAPVVRLLLARGADAGRALADGTLPLHQAAAQGDTVVLALLVGALSEARRRAAWDADGRERDMTPLALAVRGGRVGAARLLLRAGAPADRPALDPPLCRAATGVATDAPVDVEDRRAHRAAYLALARLLVEESGARPDPPCNGHSVLEWPTRAGDTTLAGYLLARGADPNRAWSAEGAPLHVVAQWCTRDRASEDLAGARFLLAHGASAELPDPESGRTLLMQAAGSPACADLLLAAGADVRARDAQGRTALHHAAGAWSVPVIARLLARGADVRAVARDGTTPLMAAVDGDSDAAESYTGDGGPLPAVEALLRAGADPSARRADGLTARDLAARNGHCRAAARLGGACAAR